MDFTFIRPAVLWLLIPALALFFIAFIKHKKQSADNLIAPHLAPFIMNESNTKASQPLWLVAVFCCLAIIFSAGPSFEEKQVPVFQSKSARVIVMDMSYSMYSTDIAPNRLMQSRFKALDMIELFKEGDTALVAYAGSAFTISPLTNDATTLTNLIPSLSPDIMPDKGSNVLAGLDMAKELLTQAGYIDGDIILVTDGIDQEEQSDITSLTSNSSYRLNIYGVGTEQGAPIKLPEGGFLKDSYGQIVIPTINISRLKSLATRSGGKFALYQPSSSDIATFAPGANSELLKDEKQSHALWRIDAGIYGLLILLPLGLYLFRSAAFVGAFLVLSVLPTQQASALELPSFLKNTDQQALDAYKNKDFERAANADSSSLKGSALYQQGNFDAALEAFSKDKSATGFYNYANALAKSGQLEQAIDAYKQAQTLQPNFSEAADNQALVEQLLEQQQQQQQQEGDSQDNQQQSDQSEQQNNQQSDQSQQGENSDSQSEQSQGEQSQEQQGEPNHESDTEQGQQSAESGSQSDKQNEPELETQPQANQEQKQPEQTNEEQAENTQPQTAQQQTLTDEQKQNAQQQAAQAQTRELTNEEKEKAQQLNQLLRKVPDDPAILLRNKMQLEAQKRQYQRRPTGVEKSW
ncbi:VWA domain-containing protein [Pseudoalteromonas sp. CST5]|uniref:vWA domain-containing protein n=1 Tax=unclassified Pseudoalteromonas TaxID=194690 RepID=UPI002358F60D|nr:MULTISPECIES: VWA domain-containing protein [unclassified Pseudoalteromonas]MDC9513245.1 VWA domain-containing protein [Pseudoalteromonas sp. CST1]MDC9537518.1 VWA domain-containing protein [Pseudoalteromonas sp. CST3]MDC9541252.1 VWA domain-containing protein [Pseudoalteromonas sp. CST2]MDC9546427.1 VWA domain-containing protein [Pseudoalteromonas sp. CST4]MDC9549155.1 VWA domain-containing protein [Pseudoalteromonas sp. CST5]